MTALQSESDVHKDIACCILRTSQGSGQCVIAKDEKGRYLLITNHHVLPSTESIKDCTLSFPSKPSLKLKAKRLYSCCGPDSVWAGTPVHVPLPEREGNGCCPRGEDWTAVILDKDVARELEKHHVTFPRLGGCDRRRVYNAEVKLVERLGGGELKLHRLDILPETGVSEGGVSIQSDLRDNVSLSRLRYPYKLLGGVDPGCTGAPIFIVDGDNVTLLGIHCSSPGSRDGHYTGLPVDFIISSLYCGESYGWSQ